MQTEALNNGCDNEQQRVAQAIVNKFADLGYPIKSEGFVVGDAVTRYTFSSQSSKLRLNRVDIFSDDIMLCADTSQDIMFYKPSDGQNVFSVEIANNRKRLLELDDLLESYEFKNAQGALDFAVGRDVEGNVIVADLAKLPHLLAAGTTGSGKSVFINGMLVSLMTKYSPEYVRFLLINADSGEMSCYNGSPYLLTAEVITNVCDAFAALDYLIAEMENRYLLFRQNGVCNIVGYNDKATNESAVKLPYLVCVVDELSIIMSERKAEFESKYMRLTQKSRAAGIHMAVTSQRADIRALTGVILANTPCRIAFKLCSVCDGRYFLGEGGAEKLVGQGDMLFWDSIRSARFKRVQGAYVSAEKLSYAIKRSVEQYGVYNDFNARQK